MREVGSLLETPQGTIATLVLYLLRVFLAMAWKSGGANPSELVHNLHSNGILKAKYLK